MKGLRNPPGFICLLWEAQQGLCFHCSEPMFFQKTATSTDNHLATREHLYPVSGKGRGMRNNVVLAHSICNNKRGAPIEPTIEEKTRAYAIYAKVGLTAFKQPPYTPQEEDHMAAMCTQSRIRLIGLPAVSHYRRRYEWNPPKLAEVMPEALKDEV